MSTVEITNLSAWLYNFAMQPGGAIESVYIFGSVLTSIDKISDVDVIIIFNEWRVRALCSDLKKEFFKKFSVPLHIQIFHCSQILEIRNFLSVAKNSRRVF